MKLPGSDGQTAFLPEPYASEAHTSLADWDRNAKTKRLWARDASVWTGRDEALWLGWLDVVGDQLAQIDQLSDLSREVRERGFRDVLLLGMGGSSLCPEVLALTFGQMPGFPPLHVLDSTDPAEVRSAERRVDLERSLFIVSSKSGSTLEPNILKQYFFELVANRVGRDEAGRRFVAITDPGSTLQAVAEQDRFWKVFAGVPSIGGRYSALSAFGIVPSAIMGLDIERFLVRTREMVERCGPEVAARDNPGVVLGTILGVLGKHGRDKVTLIASPGLAAMGAWLEQLVAESTGKNGRGLIPIDGEAVRPPDAYGSDRTFVSVALESEIDGTVEGVLDRIEACGHPVIRIRIAGRYDLGREFFRWEMAIAATGSLLGINPFDQPDVEASKVETRRLTSEFERTGRLPDEAPFCDQDGVRLYSDSGNVSVLRQSGARTLQQYIQAHLKRAGVGDYLALLAYFERNARHTAQLQAIREAIGRRCSTPTCLGFGPRFLHSTGQAYKGGPNTGVFLQITCDDPADIPVPGQRYTFGVVKAAQARGDFQVLVERKRRALRIHVGTDLIGGLEQLRHAVEAD